MNNMNKANTDRDAWDEAIRSKLEGFEGDVFPEAAEDWEAIADRLPAPALVPLWRNYRYWVAAAVIALLVLSGGVYLQLSRETGKEVIASLPQPSVPTTVTEDTVSSIPTVSSQPLIAEIGVKPSGSSTSEVNPATKESPMEMEMIYYPAHGMPSLQVHQPTLAMDNPLLAEVTPSSAKKTIPNAKKNPRRWSFGMAGGSFSVGSESTVPQFVTSTSMLRSESLENMNALDADMGTQAETDIQHHTPIRFGFSVSYALNDRLALQSGLSYSYLRSEWETNDTYHTDTDQRLHFIGVPLSLVYRIAEWKRFGVYASAGGMAELNVTGKRRVTLYSDDVEIMRESEHLRMKDLLWSVNASVGVNYPIFRFLYAFAEVGAGYYFDNGSEIQTIHSEKPFNARFQLGFALGF